jgi:hypothetical protein
MVVGTSLTKNGSGLNKTDAEFLHISKIHRKDLVRVAAKYTESQLFKMHLNIQDSVVDVVKLSGTSGEMRCQSCLTTIRYNQP